MLIIQFQQVKVETETSKNSLNHLFYTILYAALHCLMTSKEQISRWHLIAWSAELSAETEKCGFILKKNKIDDIFMPICLSLMCMMLSVHIVDTCICNLAA